METCRYSDTNKPCRCCKFFSVNSVEHENHFKLGCLVYGMYRIKYMKITDTRNHQFSNWFNCSTYKTIKFCVNLESEKFKLCTWKYILFVIWILFTCVYTYIFFWKFCTIKIKVTKNLKLEHSQRLILGWIVLNCTLIFDIISNNYHF